MLLCSGFKYRFISTQNTMGCIPKCVLMRNKYWQVFKVHGFVTTLKLFITGFSLVKHFLPIF
jgi:hypothetical protein